MIRTRKKHNKENIPSSTSCKTTISQLKSTQHINVLFTDRGLKNIVKRGSLISLASKDSTHLPLIVNKKGGSNERRRIVTEDNKREHGEVSSPFYYKIFKFKENKSIDA